MSFLCYFAVSNLVPVPNTSSELAMHSFTYRRKCLSENFRCKLYRFPTTTRIDCGNYYADMLLFSTCLRIAISLNTLTDNEVGTSCVAATRITFLPYYLRHRRRGVMGFYGSFVYLSSVIDRRRRGGVV